jgi:hypothetical protein
MSHTVPPLLDDGEPTTCRSARGAGRGLRPCAAARSCGRRRPSALLAHAAPIEAVRSRPAARGEAAGAIVVVNEDRRPCASSSADRLTISCAARPPRGAAPPALRSSTPARTAAKRVPMGSRSPSARVCSPPRSDGRPPSRGCQLLSNYAPGPASASASSARWRREPSSCGQVIRIGLDPAPRPRPLPRRLLRGAPDADRERLAVARLARLGDLVGATATGLVPRARADLRQWARGGRAVAPSRPLGRCRVDQTGRGREEGGAGAGARRVRAASRPSAGGHANANRARPRSVTYASSASAGS